MATNYFESFSSDFEILKGTFGDMKSRIALISSELDTMNSTYYTLTSNISGNLNWDDPMQKATEIRMTKTVDALKLIRDSVDDSVVPLIQKTLDTYFTTILSIKEKQKEYETALRKEAYYEDKANDAETSWNRMKQDLNNTGNDLRGAENLAVQYLDKYEDYKAKRRALEKELKTLVTQANNEKKSIKNSDTAFTLSNISASLDIAAYDAKQAIGGTANVGNENYYGYNFEVDVERANNVLDARIALLEEEAKKYKPGSEEYNLIYAEINRLMVLKYDLNDAVLMSQIWNDTEEGILEWNITLSNLLDQVFNIETGSTNASTSDIISEHVSGGELKDDLSDLTKHLGYNAEWVTEETAPAILDRLESYDNQVISDYKNGLISYEEYIRRMEVSGLLHESLAVSDTKGYLDASGERAFANYWVHQNSINFVSDLETMRLPDTIDRSEVNARITSDRPLIDVKAELENQLASYNSSNDKGVMLTTVELASKVEEGVRTGAITPKEGRDLVELIKKANHTVYWDHSTPGLEHTLWDLDRNATRESLSDLINDLEKSSSYSTPSSSTFTPQGGVEHGG